MKKPKRYQLPSKILLKPIKVEGMKPYWRLIIDGVPTVGIINKEEAYASLQRRLLEVNKDDDEIYEELYRYHFEVIRYPQMYEKREDKGYYQQKDDRHEFHPIDEVDYLKYLIKKRGEKNE